MTNESGRIEGLRWIARSFWWGATLTSTPAPFAKHAPSPSFIVHAWPRDVDRALCRRSHKRAAGAQMPSVLGRARPCGTCFRLAIHHLAGVTELLDAAAARFIAGVQAEATKVTEHGGAGGLTSERVTAIAGEDFNAALRDVWPPDPGAGAPPTPWERDIARACFELGPDATARVVAELWRLGALRSKP